jgi:SAM-dependent methyltransferase
MAKIDYFLPTFDYFKKLHPTIDQGCVLDYGSNYGMFLDSSKEKFKQSDYTGIDVDLEAIEFGRNKFPDANFIWYNGFNYMYNLKGDKIKPVLNKQYDTIISYSVFTHTTVEDTLNSIAYLYSNLKHGGKMLLTWLSIDNQKVVNFFYKKRIKEFKTCDKIQTDDYTYLINNKLSKVESAGMFLVFYKQDYLADLLKGYNFILTPAPEDSGDCFQDCIIISK